MFSLRMMIVSIMYLISFVAGFVPTMSASKPQYRGISHAGVLVGDTAKSLDFYLNVLGFEDDTSIRPNLPFKGAFVRGGSQQIHLMELPNPDPTTGRPDHAGRDRHVAFEITSIDPLIERLNEKGHPFTMSKSGRRAVFTRDIDGNGLEFLEPVDTTHPQQMKEL